MYFKLALQNVRKSYKDFLIYFLTLAFSVCLFYSFNSFQEQQAIIEMNQAQFSMMESVAMLMLMLSLFVAFVLGFLILYANNFLIKRRKKELGLYTLLGMPRGKISMILVYETFIIGVISLLIGLVLGIFLSQLLTVVTANLFEAKLNYHFIFSNKATILTIVSFSIIFFIIMIFNSVVLNRYKLIDLIHADKKNETLKVKNIYVSVILFILSIIMLGSIYVYSWTHSIEAFTFYLLPIIVVGCLGTSLFFMSLSGFLIKFSQTSKSLYFKKLNMFVLRQLNANINSNYLSMSVVCIMLLLSIGALATGMNLNKTLNNSIQMSTPYDYSLIPFFDENYVTLTPDFEQKISQLDIDPTYIQDQMFLDQYIDGTNMSDIFEEISFGGTPIPPEILKATPIVFVKQSQWNEVMAKFNEEPLSLKDNETYIFSNQTMIDVPIQNFLNSGKTIHGFGKTLTPINTEYTQYSLNTTAMVGDQTFVSVIPDSLIPTQTIPVFTSWNVNVNDTISADDFDTYVGNKIGAVNDQTPNAISALSYNQEDVRENSKGLSVIFTYIGIYLGIVFLLASAVILALQQLSQANDNRKRYAILDKIGTSKSMQNHSILLQLGIYFFMPLLLAIVHSVVGIRVVNSIVMFMGSGDIFGASLITGSIIILIYGAYFTVTYVGYKNILNQK